MNRSQFDAMGIAEIGRDLLGFEGAAIVCRVGPQVRDLRVGDRVMVIGMGTFKSLVATTESHCAKIPDKLSFDDAATMGGVYVTAIYSLFDIGGLQEGQVRTLSLSLSPYRAHPPSGLNSPSHSPLEA